jgi:excisionase family DNA binding protein
MNQNSFEASGENLEVMVEKVYTSEEAAEILKVPERNVLDLLRSGRLTGFKVGKYWRVKESDLEKFMEGKKS